MSKDLLPEALRAVWLANKPDYPPSREVYCINCGRVEWRRRDLCPKCEEERQ